MRRAIGLFLLWFVIWLLLSWPPETKDIISGLLVAIFVSFMTIDLLGRPAGQQGPSVAGLIGRLAWFIVYVGIFLWECLKANIDVAYRVIHPTLPIRPGTVRVKIHLTSDIGLTFLANSITLTPGTTSIDIDKERGFLYVHCLALKDDRAGVRVVERFERILRRIFE